MDVTQSRGSVTLGPRPELGKVLATEMEEQLGGMRMEGSRGADDFMAER